MQRNGFTLIELLVVVVVIGILATIAIGGSRSAVEQTYGAVLKSDLRNLAVAEENYFVENDRYTRRRGDLEFSVSRDVILRLRGNQRGWSARVEHRGRRPTRFFCALFRGQIRPHFPAIDEGVIACSERFWPHEVYDPGGIRTDL